MTSTNILDRFRLDGRVALVTGGGRGIGKALAEALGQAGAKVAIADLDIEMAEATATEMRGAGIETVAFEADVADQDSVKAMVASVVDHYGSLDIAFNNAGVNYNSAAEDTTMEEWDKTFNINLRGVFMCCQEEGRVMLEQGKGVIINMASMGGRLVPHPQKQAAYNAAKAGVAHLTRSLSTEWASRGVRVNSLSPGFINTELLQSDALKHFHSVWLPQVPIEKFGEVEDLQGTIVYLASDASAYMIGQDIVVDGGVTIW